MAVEQIRVGADNFSYLIYCDNSKQAVIVDPGIDVSGVLKQVRNFKLKLIYVINTHHHSDHTCGNIRVKEAHNCKLIASPIDAEKIPETVDRTVSDGEIISVGDVELKFLHTPGHTSGGVCIIVDGKFLLTGDTLFIGDCGRTDLHDGSNELMFSTLQMLKTLPDDLIVYPGHDYGKKPFDTLGNQKKINKTLIVQDIVSFCKIP